MYNNIKDLNTILSHTLVDMFFFLTAELNRGLSNSPSFLWYHDSPSRGDPIVEIKIVNNEEECPESFEKIARNMLLGSDHRAFLVIRRSKESDPIGEIRLLYSNDRQPDEGFTRLLPPIYNDVSSSISISLSCSTVSKGRNNNIFNSNELNSLVFVLVLNYFCIDTCTHIFSFILLFIHHITHHIIHHRCPREVDCLSTVPWRQV